CRAQSQEPESSLAPHEAARCAKPDLHVAPSCTGASRCARRLLASENLQQFLELEPDLLDDLLALGGIRARLFTGELVARATDGEALIVEEAADLADDDHVLALVIAAVAPPLHGLELRELLLPVAQHVGLDPAQVAHFTNGEVPLAGNRRQLGVILWLQHRLRRAPLVFVRAGMSPRGGR